MGFQEAFDEVKILIEDFKNNETYYLSPNYVEASVRQDFIDKLFTILGWDVAHNFQKNPFEQEVKVEKPQRQEGHQSQKRADYAFSLTPNYKQPVFFVEAKKPSRLLRQNRDDYFQTSKYGWNSQTGISILTDFEEIVLIDCRYKPDFETILKTEIKYYKYYDFLEEEKFAEFYFLFSREAVSEGKLRAFVKDLPKPKGKEKQLKLFGGKYQSIDESFLEYIDEIRKSLAIAFHQNNPNLEDYELTEATQRTIDRLVFMRFLEDKQIEQEDVMHNIAIATHPWEKFVETCKRFDAKYNGIVFKEHFIDRDFSGAEEITFREICSDLDHTNTPYDFNYFPIHILGNIYERFLGKIIIVENGKANIELKPEVRKAGGVFYTPKYIVDYIVQNTIGKKTENKTPKQIAELTFADIACGSGSFLIGVYEFLLDYHVKYYNENPKEAQKAGCIFDPENGVYVLNIKQKQQILLNNIYGVDIDQQATEVTQVSLFLKLLEDETMATANDMNVLFAEKILPDLSGNIKCGNSLIGWEIMDGVLEFGQKELRKLNPFSFQEAFPKVFKKGGFDAIVGNPPYVNLTNIDEFSKKYLSENYITKLDLYSLFIERGIFLTNKYGFLSFIIPSLFIKGVKFVELRNFINENSKDFVLKERGDKIFHGVNMPTCTFIITKGVNKIDYFSQKKSIFNKVEVVLLKNISTIKRGLEIGKDKLISEGNFECISGSSLKRYLIDKPTYISPEILYKYKKNDDIFNGKKLMIRETGDTFYSCIDLKNIITTRSIYNLKLSENNVSLNFIQGIINSSFFNYYFRLYIKPDTNIFPKIRIAQIKEIPIPKITSENQHLHDDLVQLVDQMLLSKKEEQHAKTEMDKNIQKRRIENLDLRINQIVYQLYQLTDEEIALVEENS